MLELFFKKVALTHFHSKKEKQNQEKKLQNYAIESRIWMGRGEPRSPEAPAGSSQISGGEAASLKPEGLTGRNIPSDRSVTAAQESEARQDGEH